MLRLHADTTVPCLQGVQPRETAAWALLALQLRGVVALPDVTAAMISDDTILQEVIGEAFRKPSCIEAAVLGAGVATHETDDGSEGGRACAGDKMPGVSFPAFVAAVADRQELIALVTTAVADGDAAEHQSIRTKLDQLDQDARSLRALSLSCLVGAMASLSTTPQADLVVVQCIVGV